MKALLFLLFASVTAFAMPAIVPSPHSVNMKEGKFTLTKGTRIIFETRGKKGMEASLKPLAKVLSSELELLTGLKLAVVDGSPKEGDILLRFAQSPFFTSEETEQIQSYKLTVSATGIEVSSPYYKGAAYGTATLLQLVSDKKVPCTVIEDKPLASYRAVMLDVARQAHSLEVIRDVIRMSRLYKMRYLHLHLTDDQNFTFPFEPITGKLEGNFAYTRQEMLDLVAYADARGVTLIPELDLPGHSTKLKNSGYLGEAKSDYDVAAPENYDKINAIISDMMEVFASSPYFHIGGDESGAGDRLLGFLQSVNQHVRKADRRLLVWEGFHGAPTKELPAKGEDRIIVMAWESTYNAPWDLLNAGYELINASWRPLYIVGGGNPVHPGSTAGRKFPAEEIYHWDKNTFMHWEPGRPVYEDRGPKDSVKGDHEWSAKNIGKEDQILGGQLLFWEQAQETVINDLHFRLQAMAEKLWNPDATDSYDHFYDRTYEMSFRLHCIVQPIGISQAVGDVEDLALNSPISDLYQVYGGDGGVSLTNHSQIEGEIRFVECSFSNSLTWIDFKDSKTPTIDGEVYEGWFTRTGGFGIRAQLFRKDGTPVEGQTWAFFNNWPSRVKVTEYDIGEKTAPKVVDMEALSEEKVMTQYELPMLRGPLRNTSIRGQKFESILTAPESGEFEVSMKTQSGHATLYLDLNQDGKCEAQDILIANTPNTEKPQLAKVTLESGEKYALRIDHNTGMPRPVVIVTIKSAEMERGKDVSAYLSLPE